MSIHARRELAAALKARYAQASRAQKQHILDEFIASTGYHRKYAIALLKSSRTTMVTQSSSRSQPSRTRHYDAKVEEALIAVWEAAGRICSKCLVPFLPEFVEVLERHDRLHLLRETREHLLSISAATVDRLRLRSGAPTGYGANVQCYPVRS